MKYIEFHKLLSEFPIFSIKDIHKLLLNFDSRRLVEWRKKGYITKVRRGYYCFSDRNKGEQFLYFAANKIYQPSYISLESGLSYYNLIPEGVFITKSVTTKNTSNFDTAIGNFDYRHIKSNLYFGYKLLKRQSSTIRIAEPEKVLLDYFYLNNLNTVEEFHELRFNSLVIKELINIEKLNNYLVLFNSKILNQRIKTFMKVTYA